MKAESRGFAVKKGKGGCGVQSKGKRIMDLTAVARNLQRLGYSVRVFATGGEAAAYLNEAIDGKTVGFGGSMSMEAMHLWESLKTHNTAYSHMHGFPLGPEAAFAQVYLSSVNGMAETGEMVLIDGYGNRAAGVIYGHEKVYLIVGRNKIAPDYDAAVLRARNIAGPMNARRKQTKTPCAAKVDHCYNCSSPERICRAMVTLWQPMLGMETEVVLIDEELGF